MRLSFFYFILSLLFRLRYRFEIKGWKNLPSESRSILFLPNHVSQLDPFILSALLWRKYRLRPLVIEYMYYLSSSAWLMRLSRALPIPNFSFAPNSFKQKRYLQMKERIVAGLQEGDNFLIYPAGQVKRTEKELLEGKSGVHDVLCESSSVSAVVLIRITGLWGSLFSRALTKKRPLFFQTLHRAFLLLLKNGLFFMPRRKVVIEFETHSPQPLAQMSRCECNRFLQEWYNKPPGDRLQLVSLCRWKEELPAVEDHSQSEMQWDQQKVDSAIAKRVIKELSEFTRVKKKDIHLDSSLDNDLGMDSIDRAALLSFLDREYHQNKIPFHALTTVRSVALSAMGKCPEIAFDSIEEGSKKVDPIQRWGVRPSVGLGEQVTLIEAFLYSCDRMGPAIAGGDLTVGEWSYSRCKTVVLLLAERISHFEGDHIGILLPASLTCYLLVFACQLAQKVPVMLNWTTGCRNVTNAIEQTGLCTILSSWKFLDQLPDPALEGNEEKVVLLEELLRGVTVKQKIKALYHSLRSVESVLKQYGLDDLKPHSRAVVLFTSGSEAYPKGVILTHENLLSNIEALFQIIDWNRDDLLLGFLPPFHSFGLTVTGLFPFLSGIRAFYFPNPNDSKRVASLIQRWQTTITFGTPTFLQHIVQNSQKEELRTLRLLISGAEKAPRQLFDMVEALPSNPVLLEGYGITECSPVITCNRMGLPKEGVGYAIPEVHIAVVDPETHAPLAAQQVGMVVVAGPNVCMGYLGGIDLPTFSWQGKRWYLTGDLGEMSEKGALTLVGRKKRCVKIGGEMISLKAMESTIEEVLLKEGQLCKDQLPAVVVMPILGQEGQMQTLSLLTTCCLTLEEANRCLKKGGLSNLIRVDEVRRIRRVPLLGSGKIDYPALEKEMEEQE